MRLFMSRDCHPGSIRFRRPLVRLFPLHHPLARPPLRGEPNDVLGDLVEKAADRGAFREDVEGF